MIALALAAGSPVWTRPDRQSVEVWTDLSPSTRTADFRHRDRLQHRLAELLGDVPYRIRFFADGEVMAPSGANVLPDVACEQTRYPSSSADNVLLFSDAQFHLRPSGPPTYVVVDPALDDSKDAAVTRLEIRGDDVVATLLNRGQPRPVAFAGASPSEGIAAQGATVLSRQRIQTAASISAQLRRPIRGPKTIHSASMPRRLKSCRTGGSATGTQVPAGSAFRPNRCRQTPSNISRRASSSLTIFPLPPSTQARQDCLENYVSEMGGGLLLLGGEHAFPATDAGSKLIAVSPLSVTAPMPTVEWLLLTDGSGSMADEASPGISRWSLATGALRALLPHLPPDDPVSVGAFSRDLRWWSDGKDAKATASLALPRLTPRRAGPPISSRRCSKSLQTSATMPRYLLVVTDAETRIDRPDELIGFLRQKNIHLNVLAIGSGTGLTTLTKLAEATGGHVVQKLSPAEWTAGALDLLAAAAPATVRHDRVQVTFAGPMLSMPPRQVQNWNLTWRKSGADELAVASVDGQSRSIAARWRVGAGMVTAAAFSPPSEDLPKWVDVARQSPRDPRLQVTWEAGETLRVRITATDAGRPLNELDLRLKLGQTAGTQPIPQTAPGAYELDLPAPRSAVLAQVFEGNRLADRAAIAGRYAPEFDQIGNNRRAMEQLARSTSGKVILPSDHGPIDFAWPPRKLPLAPWIAAAAIILAAAALMIWRNA